jgi:rSAM/selenodomain-associated transferase 1
MNNRNALIIIAKYPEKDNVKTRLKGLIPDPQRLALYVSLLNQTIQNLGSIRGVDTFIAFAPDDTEEYFSRFNLKLIPLHEGDLGVRMFEAFKEVFSAGYKKAALVGADIPDLTAAIILNAFDLLQSNDLVYGPAKDGGYYLVAMKTLIKEVFENVPWSSGQTLNKSLRQAEKYGYRTGFTETLSDIDTYDDVKRSGLLKS